MKTQFNLGKRGKDMQRAIASKTLSNFGGIVILQLNDDFVVSAENYGSGNIKKSKAMIRYNAKGEPYFKRQGKREYLRDYMRV